MSRRVVSSNHSDAHDADSSTSSEPASRRNRGNQAARHPGPRSVRSGDTSTPARMPADDILVSPQASEGFIDARQLKPGPSVAERIEDPRIGGNPGMLVRPKIVNFPSRRKERQTAAVHGIVRRIVVLVLVVLIVAGCGWAAFLSPLFRYDASTAVITGTNQWIDASQVESIVDADNGTSLLLVDSHSIASKLDAIVGVSDVKVQRRFPHGLVVTFTSAQPAAVLHVTSDNSLVPVTQDGEQLVKQSDESAYGSIPRIDVDSVDAVANNEATAQAVKVLGGLGSALAARVTSTTAPTRDSITSVMDDGVTVLWGDSSDIAFKASVVSAILGKKDAGDANYASLTYINVSSADSPIIK